MGKLYSIHSYTIIRNTMKDFVKDIPYMVAIITDNTGTRKTEYIHGYRDGMKLSFDTLVLQEDETKEYYRLFVDER